MTKIAQLLNVRIPCTCGKDHFVPIRDVDFEFQEEKIGSIIKKHIEGEILLIVADKHTESFNHSVFHQIQKAGYQAELVEFEDKKLIPDEKAVGRVLMATDRNISGIVAIGSGTVNDINRLVGDRIKVPVVTIATAPSMDGYAASGSSMMVQGVKKTIKNSTVSGIYAKMDVVRNCPYDLIQAGFGDIIGKKTALADWVLSRELTGEYWCDQTVSYVEESTQKCIDNKDQIARREEQGIRDLTEALVLSGIAMAMVDDTRPASGSEHLVSHYLVMKAIEKGQLPPSHGRTVGIGTLISVILYEFLFDHATFQKQEKSEELKEKIKTYLPKKEEVIDWLTTLELSTHPKDYDVDEDLMEELIHKAGFIRDRYTIFTYLNELGLIDECAAYVKKYFYK